MLVGRKTGSGIGMFERTFNRCMGLWSNGQTLLAATAFQIWRFEDILHETTGDYDRLYVPRVGYTTGDIDVNDLTRADGKLWFINICLFALKTAPP